MVMSRRENDDTATHLLVTVPVLVESAAFNALQLSITSLNRWDWIGTISVSRDTAYGSEFFGSDDRLVE
jgi:hypothetical protein